MFSFGIKLFYRHFHDIPLENANALFEDPPAQDCPSTRMIVESDTGIIAKGFAEGDGRFPTVTGAVVPMFV